MKIIPLSEGSFTIDKSKVFVPFDRQEDDLKKRSSGSLLVEVQPFAVVTGKDVLLIDAGLGFSKEGALQIYKNLEANGIRPSAVTKVLMSHLHKDHAGGVSVKDDAGNYSLTFPNATYFIQQQEIDYALEVGVPSYIPEELHILNTSTSVEKLNGNGIIDGYIHYEISGGHCPYHQVFRIEEDGQILFFGGDVTPQLGQMKSRLMAKYDHDGKKSMELRHHWWEIGQQQDWTFLFYHDIKKPIWPVL
jgi:glyoxylase-like metal-dependent hydrolase (beta-lactamase superfamily II)